MLDDTSRQYLIDKLAKEECQSKCGCNCDTDMVDGMMSFYESNFQDFDLISMALTKGLIQDRQVCREIGGRWHNNKCYH